MRTTGYLLALLLLAAGMAPAATREPVVAGSACDGDFHLVERFTRGKRTGVTHPALEGDRLWVLQTFENERGRPRALLKRWDGSEWSRLRVPLSGGNRYITSLDTTPDGSVWLTARDDLEPGRPVILRWDGDRWQESPTGDLPEFSFLNDIDMWSSDEGWAVGSYESEEALRALVLRWNGNVWTQVPIPVDRHSEISSVSMTAPDDVWALVVTDRSTVHWDGLAWTRHPLPDRRDHVLQPYDIEARSGTEAWVAGAWERRSSASALASWDGSRWSTEEVKDRRGLDWLLAIDSGSAVWTVGERRTRDKTSPIALRITPEGRTSVGADDPGRGGHFGDLVVEEDVAWATGRASSRKLGLFGVLQRACTSDP